MNEKSISVRERALSLLLEYEASGKYANLSLASHHTDGLSLEDRALLTHLFYTAVERKITYDYYAAALSGRSCDDITPRARNILRLGFAQLLASSSIPTYAAVNETVKLGTGAGERSFINGVMRAAARAAEEGTLPMPKRERNEARYLSVKYSVPLSLAKELLSSFGEEAEALLTAYNSVGYTDITVNTTRTDKDALIRELGEEGLVASPSLYSSLGIRVTGSFNPTRYAAFREGRFFVEDEASLVSQEALGARVGDTVVDVCSAPGGKSLATASLTHGGAKIYSFDLHSSKLSLISASAERLGFDITVAERDAREPDESLLGRADRVICDVPCSGLGVLGKKPDLRYRDASEDASLPTLQHEILSASAKYLRPGGEIMYSTCTLRDAENREVVERFLSEHPDFSTVEFAVGALRSSGGMLTLLPHVHKTDGFFMAKLRREK